MELLEENKYQSKKMPNNKKIVLILMVISIIALIAVLIAMLYLNKNKVKKQRVIINGQEIAVEEGLIVSDSAGNEYISIKQLATIIGYNYYNNAYLEDGKDSTKCYIKNNNLITGFEMDRNRIFKYEEKTKLDYQYYDLACNIMYKDNQFYIALVDLRKALNIVCYKDSKNNIIGINSIENLAMKYTEELKDKGYKLSDEQNNQKALAYNWIITEKDGYYGVLDTNYEEIINNIYSSIYFDEQNLNYIVSKGNTYSIISTEGSMINESVICEGLEILNYENKLYKVKDGGKYGIIKADGTILFKPDYDEIGCPEDTAKRIEYTLIIPKLDERTGKSIVVKKDNKYGLIYLETGEVFIPCDNLDKIYYKNKLGDTGYKVLIEGHEMDLTKYIDWYFTQVLNLN